MVDGATRRRFMLGAGVTLAASATIAGAPEDLERITQALADALAPGNADFWAAWTHPDFVVTDENGARIERKEFLAEMRPLPPGTSGTIRVADFNSKRVRETRVTTYVLEELEHYHGEDLHARYRQTDTWVATRVGWRLFASQIIALRTDPPAMKLPAKLWTEYAGRYRLPDGLELELLWDGSSAALRKSGGSPRPLKAELPDLLFVPGDPRIRYLADRGTDGRVVRLVQRRESWDIVWKRI